MTMTQPHLADRFQALYTRYGYRHTRKRLGLNTERMRAMIDSLALEPCPRSHVLLRYVAADTGRDLRAVVSAAERDGVLRRTRAPGATMSGARSVPATWAQAYEAECRAYDRLHELLDAGWLTSRDVATRFGRHIATVGLATDGSGSLAPYLTDARRYQHGDWTAWHPDDVRAALDRYREHEHTAQRDLVPLADLVAHLAGKDRRDAYRTIGSLGVIRCKTPGQRGTAMHVRRQDADRIRAALGGA